MEIIIAIIAVLAIAIVLYSRKPKELVEAEQAEAVPYKVETPAVSPVAEQASQAVVESIAPAKKPRAPRKTATTTAKKPAAKKTTAAKKPKAK